MRKIILTVLLLLLAAVNMEAQTTGTRPGLRNGILTLGRNADSLYTFPPTVPDNADSSWTLYYGAGGALVWLQAGGGSGYYEAYATAVDTTTDATTEDAISISLSEQQVVSVLAMTTARSTDDEVASYRIVATFYRNTGGDVTILGSSIILDSHYSASADWNFDIVADAVNQTVDVQITGANLQTVYWNTRASYEIRGE